MVWPGPKGAWLAKQDSELVTCRRVCLYMTAVALLDTANAISSDHLVHTPPPSADAGKARTTRGVAYRNFHILKYLRSSMQINQDSPTTEPEGESSREIEWMIKTHPFFFHYWEAKEDHAKALIWRMTKVVDMGYEVIEGSPQVLPANAGPAYWKQSSSKGSVGKNDQLPEHGQQEANDEIPEAGTVPTVERERLPTEARQEQTSPSDSASAEKHAAGTFSISTDSPGSNPMEEDVADGVADGEYISEKPTKYINEECLDNILIWRTIILAMLFYTAEDNGEIMASGRWGHVIPIL
ncbi:hypothetical protein F5B20DRAFT_519581 [Whalleya microplaca]|nr:hypothetical protein F5B20DRAFT_519581 [Whalleya microplaca]